MFELIIQNLAAIQNVGVVFVAVLAFWKGGAPERACAAVFLGMFGIDRLYHLFFGLDQLTAEVDLWHAFLDTTVLVVLVWIALKSNRFYPMVLAAAQVVAFTTHLVRMLVEPFSSLSYYLLVSMPSWFQLTVFAIGLARHVQRTSLLGPYRDWRPDPHQNDRLKFS